MEFRGAGKIIDWNVETRLNEISVRTLLLSGKYDEVTPACVEKVRQGISGSEWILFEDSSQALHNGATKSGRKRCGVQNVAQPISVKTVNRKVNKITFVRSADGSSLTPILRLLDTRMSLSGSASECTSMA
jgi:hypothetical protein